MSTTKSFHWSVKTHKIEELEKALNDYDEMGWEIFDVDVTAHAANNPNQQPDQTSHHDLW